MVGISLLECYIVIKITKKQNNNFITNLSRVDQTYLAINDVKMLLVFAFAMVTPFNNQTNHVEDLIDVL